MSMRVEDSAYVESPTPLTDRERREMKRMFSDFFEVPAEWKQSLRADLERDPPILGKVALGGYGGAALPLASLASSGQIGSSGVFITSRAVWLFDLPMVRSSAGTIDIYASTIRLGPSQDVEFGRQSSGLMKVPDLYLGSGVKVVVATDGTGQLDFRTDVIRFGFSPTDVALVRFAADTIEIPDQLIVSPNVGANLTPLFLNENGTIYQVRVGGAGTGPGGVGRMLFVS